MPELTGPEQRRLIELLEEHLPDQGHLNRALIHAGLGKLSKYAKDGTLPAMVGETVGRFSNQYRIVELVAAVLNHPEGLNGSCPPLENWLNDRKELLPGKTVKITPGIPEELAFLIDRDKHIGPFRDHLEQSLGRRPRQASVVVIYGHREAAHQNLVGRLISRREGLARLGIEKHKHLKVIRPIHDEGGEAVLLRELCDSFGAGGSRVDDLVSVLSGGPDRYDLVALEILLRTSELAGHNFRMIERLLGFWETVKGLPDDSSFV